MTKLNSPEQIAKWKVLEAIATPGPWEVIPDGKSHRVINPAGDAELGNWTVAGDVWWLTNAAFIAAAREAVPKLIADRAAILAEREELKALMLANEGVLVDAPALAVKERDRAEAAEASLAEARAEIERLREGLRPFAERAKNYNNSAYEDFHLAEHNSITIGDLRRARALLEDKK